MPITTFVNKEFLNKLSEVYPCKHCMNIEGKPISSKDIYDAYKFSAEIFLNFSNTPTLITQITEILNKSGEWFKLSCTYSNEWPIIKSKRRINIKK